MDSRRSPMPQTPASKNKSLAVSVSSAAPQNATGVTAGRWRARGREERGVDRCRLFSVMPPCAGDAAKAHSPLRRRGADAAHTAISVQVRDMMAEVDRALAKLDNQCRVMGVGAVAAASSEPFRALSPVAAGKIRAKLRRLAVTNKTIAMTPRVHLDEMD